MIDHFSLTRRQAFVQPHMSRFDSGMDSGCLHFWRLIKVEQAALALQPHIYVEVGFRVISPFLEADEQ